MPTQPTHWLVPIAGPTLEPLPLTPHDRPTTLGRNEACDLLLPASAEKVSRFHAQFLHHDNRWHITDLKSRWGTSLNGRPLTPDQPVPLKTSDLLHIAPWTFLFSTSPTSRGLKLADDEHHSATMIHTLPGSSAGSIMGRPLGDDLLPLLLESAAGIHNAVDEKSLAEVLLDTAIRGTGLRNAALLRPLDAQGTFEVIATRQSDSDATTTPYSRTLINAASAGDIAEFSSAMGSGAAPISQSIAQMNVTSAICVPLMLGSTVAAYLYLDSRGHAFSTHHIPPSATAFCAALGRIASLALANLKRLDMEHRAASVEAELMAGAEAQRFILPQRTATIGKFAYIGHSQPGRYVGGDFFDILPLDNDRLAVALADVAGKGIPASVLMAAAQGYLHSALQQHADLSAAVRALNQFICPRCPSNKFLTMFVAVLDPHKNTLTCVDAGHGYGLLRTASQNFAPLQLESSLPIGLSADIDFPATTIPFPPGSELLIVSDGIIEQPAPTASDDSPRQQFDLAGVQSTLATLAPSTDPIATLFQAVVTFAKSPHLADDATAVLVRYNS